MPPTLRKCAGATSLSRSDFCVGPKYVTKKNKAQCLERDYADHGIFLVRDSLMKCLYSHIGKQNIPTYSSYDVRNNKIKMITIKISWIFRVVKTIYFIHECLPVFEYLLWWYVSWHREYDENKNPSVKQIWIYFACKPKTRNLTKIKYT